MSSVYTVMIQRSVNDAVSVMRFDTNAALRHEVLHMLMTREPESAPLFNGMFLVFQHRDSLECVRAGDDNVGLVENTLASELAGFNNPGDDRIYDSAFIVSMTDNCTIGGISEEDANRLHKILSKVDTPKDMNPLWGGKLAYVEELSPGKGFAYFVFGSENPSAFVGWDREPRAMYAEPPFDTPRVNVERVGYIAPGLVVTDSEASVLKMACCRKPWLVSREAGVEVPALCGIDEFKEAVRKSGGNVFTED